MSNTDKLQEIKQQLDEVLTDELGFNGVDGTYIYCLTRVKEAFHVGTMTLDDFVEVDEEFTHQIIERVMFVVSPLISQLEQAQAELFKWHNHARNVEAMNQKLRDELKRVDEFYKYVCEESSLLQAENEQLEADKQKLVEGFKTIATTTASMYSSGWNMAANLQDIAKYKLSEVDGKLYHDYAKEVKE